MKGRPVSLDEIQHAIEGCRLLRYLMLQISIYIGSHGHPMFRLCVLLRKEKNETLIIRTIYEKGLEN